MELMAACQSNWNWESTVCVSAGVGGRSRRSIMLRRYNIKGWRPLQPLLAFRHWAKPLFVNGFVGSVFFHRGESFVYLVNPLTTVFQCDAILLAFVQFTNGFNLA